MADSAHRKTDRILAGIEKRLAEIYTEAQEGIQKKASAYFSKFEKLDAEKRNLVEEGKLTDGEYAHWRRGKIMYGKRFKSMEEEIARSILNVNQTAMNYVNGEMPEIYALNYNALERQVDGVGGYSFTLTDADTVRHLSLYEGSLLPHKELDPTKDIPWNMKNINSQVLQGILQGDPIDKIAGRILRVQEMNKNAAIRTARTIVTEAENKGRQDSYERAVKDGIVMKREWIATNDNRVRHWHAELDGVLAEVDEAFENGYGKIMFPGDHNAHPANVYNCRCTLAAKVLGFEKVRR
jgi:SPP1 gp7 family putative phage head morphogenesis protein